MRKTVIVDDLTDEEGAEPVTFSLDGVAWQIDLVPANKQRLAEALDPFILVAQRVRLNGTDATSPRKSTATRPPGVDLMQLRAWAASHDVELPQRGRIPRAIVEQYEAWASAPRPAKRVKAAAAAQ